MCARGPRNCRLFVILASTTDPTADSVLMRTKEPIVARPSCQNGTLDVGVPMVKGKTPTTTPANAPHAPALAVDRSANLRPRSATPSNAQKITAQRKPG